LSSRAVIAASAFSMRAANASTAFGSALGAGLRSASSRICKSIAATRACIALAVSSPTERCSAM
jgi:hypothetical protein